MLNLAGQWSLQDGSGEHSITMTVPGDGISALMASGVIPDPYHGRNEYDVRWVAERDWVLSREFSHEIDGQQYELEVCELDCIAEILLNGASILSTSNVFRKYRVDITEQLRSGQNTIEILFTSSTAEANRLQAAQPYEIPYLKANCDIANGNMLRKVQCDFGWDWNIALAPFGLYGTIQISPVTVRIERFRVEQNHANSQVDLKISADIINGVDGQEFKLKFGQQDFEGMVSGGELALEFQVENPQLWWPAGSGAQVLYDLEIEVGEQILREKIGLRTIELLTKKRDDGREFVFAVNGKRLYMRGANWIPQDALPGRVTQKVTCDLLQSAVDANMNMIRVWGGGRYEPDWFYDMCSELGLLVWQDFMFSCNLYPADDAYLSEVDAEVREQTDRLSHHACLALWCGDNELVGALGWFEVSRSHPERYLENYKKLNATIKRALLETNPVAVWWPSSPSLGHENYGDGWHDDSSGDMHYWSVWHEGKSFDNYREVKPGFCSEFGFQSFSSMNVIRQFASDDDLNIGSPVMESHQKNDGGNARITETMFRYFRFPEGFENFVYLSQVQQGLAIKTAVDYWRSLKPRCMGTLYWQLNDTWPVASWSSLNYGGDWKAMHFMAKRFFQPVNVMIIPDGDELKIIVVNDTMSTVKLDVKLMLVALDGTRTDLRELRGNVGTESGELLASLPANSIPDGHILTLTFASDNGMSGENHHANLPYKSLTLADPELTFSTRVTDDGIVVTLNVQALALYVTLEAEFAGRFSDNCFMMLPGQSREVLFVPSKNNFTAAADTIMVRDLYNCSRRRNR
ncbi:MAG: beta-mannosidase [Hyphomicrobiales bacterium]|nr:MAG: beta-mannosidase [Hyphomicrobiales bacterium]